MKNPLDLKWSSSAAALYTWHENQAIAASKKVVDKRCSKFTLHDAERTLAFHRQAMASLAPLVDKPTGEWVAMPIKNAPLGARCRYPEYPNRVYVLLERHGRGSIAVETRANPNANPAMQQLFCIADSNSKLQNTLMEVWIPNHSTSKDPS